MGNGDIFTTTIPIELDYLAPADTVLTFVNTSGLYDPVFVNNLTFTIVDISGRNSVRKLVGIVTAREV